MSTAASSIASIFNVTSATSNTSLALYTFTALVVILTAMPFLRKNQFSVKGRLVIVTGGSQGMGLSVAQRLSAKGAHVAIIARNRPKLDKALPSISSAAADPSSQRFLAVSADLSVAAEARRAFDEILAWHGGPPEIVWQCAGSARPGYFKDEDAEVLENCVKVNYIQAMHTAHNALRVMTSHPNTTKEKKEKRHLIFTSSVLSLYPLAGYNSYSPSKAAIRALADGLRQECLLYDIAVHCCFPATIYSPGLEEENKTKPELTKILEGGDEGQTPDKVAEVCIKKLERGQFLVVTSFLGEALRGAAWGGSPRGEWVWDTVFGSVIMAAWGVIGRVMDHEVIKYRRKAEKEGSVFK